jgi:hypothetical protein
LTARRRNMTINSGNSGTDSDVTHKRREDALEVRT